MAYCPNCGTEVAAGANFCTECGFDVPDVGASATQQSRRGNAEGETQSRGARPTGAPRDDHQYDSSSGHPQRDVSSSGVSRRTLLAATGVALGAGWLVSQGNTATNALTSGGGSTPPLDRMQVRFVDVRQPDFGVTSATLPLILSFENPANRAIPDISGDFDIYLEGTRIGSDEITVNRLESGEETKVNLDVIVEYADYGDAVIEALRSGSYTIEIRGSVNAGGASRSIRLSTGP